MVDALLEVTGLKKGYGEGGAHVDVLRGIYVSIGRGELCVLLGPSGSGKSTFLNPIGGLERADTGSVRVGGVDLTSLSDRGLGEYRHTTLGFVFQFYNLMEDLTIILTNATIEKGSSVIGTLLASGWRKGEILRHYLLLPALVGLVACALGNALGYTLSSGVTQGLCYNSYSIPPFHMACDVRTFVMTSVVPCAMLVGVTLVGLARKLRATPLAFLRHEVSRGRRRHLPAHRPRLRPQGAVRA